MIRMLKSAKDSTMKGCTQAINQMKGMVVTAPVELRAVLRDLISSQLVARCVGWRSVQLKTPTTAAKYTLRSLVRRYTQLAEEIKDLNKELVRLTVAFAALCKASPIAASSGKTNRYRLNPEATAGRMPLYIGSSSSGYDMTFEPGRICSDERQKVRPK